MEPTNSELVARMQSGDREAFDHLVNRYRHMVYGLGYHLSHDFKVAQDLAQDTFVQAFIKLDQLRAPDRFSGWLRQIMLNIWRMHRRRPDIDTVTLEEANQVADARHPSDIESVVQDAMSKEYLGQ